MIDLMLKDDILCVEFLLFFLKKNSTNFNTSKLIDSHSERELIEQVDIFILYASYMHEFYELII